jgi:hypothetical protein
VYGKLSGEELSEEEMSEEQKFGEELTARYFQYMFKQTKNQSRFNLHIRK